MQKQNVFDDFIGERAATATPDPQPTDE